MPRRFSTLFLQQLEPFTRAWVDAVYADRRTDLATLLSFRELIEQIPDILEELGFLLDEGANVEEICEAARRLRGFARARFHQGVLLDEVARELMLLKDALSELLWNDLHGVGESDTRELHDALRRAQVFFDELIAQAILVYAASLRPVIPTRGSVWPPPRGRRKG